MEPTRRGFVGGLISAIASCFVPRAKASSIKFPDTGSESQSITHYAVSSPSSAFFLALHTAKPRFDQLEHEATFNGYERQSIGRTTDQWSIGEDLVTNARDISFGTNVGPNYSVTHFSIGLRKNGQSPLITAGEIIDPETRKPMAVLLRGGIDRLAFAPGALCLQGFNILAFGEL